MRYNYYQYLNNKGNGSDSSEVRTHVELLHVLDDSLQKKLSINDPLRSASRVGRVI